MSAVRTRRVLYACTAALAAAGLLLIIGEQPAHPGPGDSGNPPHANSAVNERYENRKDARGNVIEVYYQFPGEDKVSFTGSSLPDIHRTYWECPSGKTCYDEGNLPVYQPGTRLVRYPCVDHDCAHSISGLFGKDYTEHWQYAGHEDLYRTKWDGCSGDYLNPETEDRWGPRSTLRTPPAPGNPTVHWPHCRPKPTLTVTAAAANEGGTLRFKATLSHASGKIYWSTAAGTGTNAALYFWG